MDASNSPGRIRSALKELLAHWDRTESCWHDSVRRSFEEEHLGPIEAEALSTAKEMDRLGQMIRQALQECQ